jgi:hypothetical protein
MTTKRQQRLLRPRPGALSFSDDERHFERQLSHELKLDTQLALDPPVMTTLLERHSICALALFLTSHAKLIKSHRYLLTVQLPKSELNAISTSMIFPWLPNMEKEVFTLDAHCYCFLSKSERKTFIKVGNNAGMAFLSLYHCILSYRSRLTFKCEATRHSQAPPQRGRGYS